ncbi:CLUMA_CG000275, isoform A [Clunio marinus]|uniref:CLUMA_CG000275, isoform A n=1 Tax=Clunio marinus TaxID=568069 RepID=A0A1J1HEG7_9DIPT|nr:CLUMA_CG000275, isoform A [Clunio marinus]
MCAGKGKKGVSWFLAQLEQFTEINFDPESFVKSVTKIHLRSVNTTISCRALKHNVERVRVGNNFNVEGHSHNNSSRLADDLPSQTFRIYKLMVYLKTASENSYKEKFLKCSMAEKMQAGF